MLDDVLDGRGPEVVAVALHRQAIDAHGLGVPLQDGVGNELLADNIALHHSFDHCLGHILVVGQQLLRIFREAVAAVTEGRVVIVSADTRVHAHAVDDLLRVQALDLRVGIKLVEVADAHSEVGIGEELDGLGLGRMGDQGLDILILGALGKQICKHLCLLLLMVVGAHHDTAGMEVIVERLAFAEELRREDDIVDAVFLAHTVRVADRDGALDDHQDHRVDLQHMLDCILNGARIEEVVLVVIVGRRGDDDQLGRLVGSVLVHGRGQVELALPLERLAEEALDLIVLNRANELIEFVRLRRRSGYSSNFVVLCQQHGQRQTDIADTGNGDIHSVLFFCSIVHKEIPGKEIPDQVGNDDISNSPA